MMYMKIYIMLCARCYVMRVAYVFVINGRVEKIGVMDVILRGMCYNHD